MLLLHQTNEGTSGKQLPFHRHIVQKHTTWEQQVEFKHTKQSSVDFEKGDESDRVPVV